MSEVSTLRMTVDEFLAWAEGRSGRYELIDGRICAMAPEQVRHARSKGRVYAALDAAIRHAQLPCEVLPDGVTIRIDRSTAFEPDALVRCGPQLDGDAIEIPDPLIVVEVLSPGTQKYDIEVKFAGYFALPSLQHYLIVDLRRRVVVHHRRDGDEIRSRILGAGMIHLEPPGICVAVEDVLGQP